MMGGQDRKPGESAGDAAARAHFEQHRMNRPVGVPKLNADSAKIVANLHEIKGNPHGKSPQELRTEAAKHLPVNSKDLSTIHHFINGNKASGMTARQKFDSLLDHVAAKPEIKRTVGPTPKSAAGPQKPRNFRTPRNLMNMTTTNRVTWANLIHH